MDYHLHLFPMKNIFITLLLIVVGCLVSCKKSNQDKAPVEVAKTYYQSLDGSDLESLNNLLADSVLSKELDYKVSFSKDGYMDLQRWDSVFHPAYTILEMEEVDGKVKLKISKACFRTLFLNGEPIITQETISFTKGKISSVGIDEYVVFNWGRWDSVRGRLVDFINKNHPELDGFLHDQTVEGALKYTEAIQLFKQNKEARE